MPEYLLGIMITAILGWGGFTWRRAEDAIVAAIKADDRVDRLEVKIAEDEITRPAAEKGVEGAELRASEGSEDQRGSETAP